MYELLQLMLNPLLPLVFTHPNFQLAGIPVSCESPAVSTEGQLHLGLSWRILCGTEFVHRRDIRQALCHLAKLS